MAAVRLLVYWFEGLPGLRYDVLRIKHLQNGTLMPESRLPDSQIYKPICDSPAQNHFKGSILMKQLTSIQTNPFNLSVSACDEALQSSESIAYQKAQEGRSPRPGTPGEESNNRLGLKRCTYTRQQ